MITLKAQIFVTTKTVDFRGAFERLGEMVRERLNDDPRSGAFFVFFNRAANRIKILSAVDSGTESRSARFPGWRFERCPWLRTC